MRKRNDDKTALSIHWDTYFRLLKNKKGTWDQYLLSLIND